MNIKKINIENFKCFRGKFSLDLNSGINILVGDNEAGKSTILEAIHLGLSGLINGRYLKNQLSQYLFNSFVVKEYIENLNAGKSAILPQILIELFFSGKDWPLFEGNGNTERKKGCGVQFKIEFDTDYQSEYETLISSRTLSTIPIEYYKITWKSFARDSVTSRSIPIKSVIIDSTSNKYQNGSDVYISRIIRDDLDEKEKIEISQAYRRMKDSFMVEESVIAINAKIKNKTQITGKDLKVSVDLSTYDSWENTLMTYLDDVPFHQIGKGEQCIIKTNLALGHKKSQEANLILLEEPENHLSHSKMNQLIKSISERSALKQIIISTHSSFVANKLGLDNLILLNNQKVTRLSELTEKGTQDFFRKLPGYKTLRLLLCRKAILVEGDSDELIFQKAYMENNSGRLPIEDRIDVISVSLSFKRFLEIASVINKPVAVITDNDGDFENNITGKYKDYSTFEFINICADNRNSLNTLEPQFVDANSLHLDVLCKGLGIKLANHNTTDKISTYMIGNKTNWALNVFETKENLNFPEYILRAVRWCNE